MTHTDIPTRCLALQLKLMDALDAAWAILERTHDPAEIRKVRDKAKAIGELAAMARKVAQMTPTARKPPVDVLAAGLAAVQGGAGLGVMAAPLAAPLAAQAEHARRALDKLKGGRRGRL
ncbi:hypothetical protein J2800_001227 [Caulobacter rhizosphaerae]|uniref:Uncharacterized protein n=1 Tax=Caulobacter rhizosphaerae TaxID=2010972 RepID=A0ABU1MXR1_9CAUL|nr:hypothetical protein [Caulobacter rhizosphaerae]MDR6530491.1 hypothetical protein [Caulobacter rhizosphaerae]